MPLGFGWWYDRRSRRWYQIDEHATNARDFWRRFRAKAVAHLNPTRDRDAIVRHVARQGFIRVRFWKNHLGWEFHGKPDQALSVLRRFLRRHEVGPFVQVNVSDFHSGISICVSVSEVAASRSAAILGFRLRRRKH